MPREAKLSSSSSGSVVRGFSKFQANIPPRWMRNARHSRKRMEPAIADSLAALKRLNVRVASGSGRARGAGVHVQNYLI
jgi:hypothetical protein